MPCNYETKDLHLTSRKGGDPEVSSYHIRFCGVVGGVGVVLKVRGRERSNSIEEIAPSDGIAKLFVP